MCVLSVIMMMSHCTKLVQLRAG